ncbi:MAG: fumarylacetoacetate hydrolase family protein [Rhodospirillales bacterium]|nr:fumarylacetoacetate hydrolase family protein [Rhodospirillales bacterium]
MSQSHESAAALAERLFAEHAEGRPFRRLRGADRPSSLAEGYRVQELLVRRWVEAGRGRPAGYKVGLTSEAIQTMYGSDQPISGVVFESGVHRSPARIALSHYGRLGIEFELAVEIGTDFRPEDAPFSLDDAVARVAACMPAFELIEDRHADHDDVDAPSILVDNAWCAGVVLGPRRADWRTLDLASTAVSLRVNDALPSSAVTGAAMGNPLHSLVWLAGQLASRGTALAAGTIVMTGSTLATQFPDAGDRFVYEIEGLGGVEATVV